MIDTEEIVGILRNAQAEVEWDYPMDYAAAIDEAIEALYVKDDLIKHRNDAGAFIDGILRRARNKASLSHYWIISGNQLRCPICGHYFKDAYDMDNFDNYCRNCGTRMEGIKNG